MLMFIQNSKTTFIKTLLYTFFVFLVVLCFSQQKGNIKKTHKELLFSEITIVWIGVSTPYTNTTPSLLLSPSPLKSGNCPSSSFRQFPPIYWFFVKPPKKWILKLFCHLTFQILVYFLSKNCIPLKRITPSFPATSL